jgi:hypothetical protein
MFITISHTHPSLLIITPVKIFSAEVFRGVFGKKSFEVWCRKNQSKLKREKF